PRFARRQVFQRAIDDVLERRARLVEIFRSDCSAPSVLPLSEELFEYLMDELALPARVHHLLVVGLLIELQHMACEEPERAPEVGLERADRPCARWLRTDGSVKFRSTGRRAGDPHFGPAPD